MNSEKIILNITTRLRDDFSYDNKFFELQSNINDKDSVLLEHNLYNSNKKYLQCALIQKDGKYYFFDVRRNSTFLKQHTDSKKFICPCCQQELYPVSKHFRQGCREEIPAHLRHYPKDEKAKNCLFNNYKEFTQYDGNYLSSESKMHKQLKMALFKLGNSGLLEIPIQEKCIVDVNNRKFSVKADFEYKNIKIISAEMEKKVLSKDEISRGYQPDIIFYGENNEVIYCEATVTSGKKIDDYVDIWERLGNVVLEVKYKKEKNNENINMDSIEELVHKLICINSIKESSEQISDINEQRNEAINDKISVSYAYCPLVEKCRAFELNKKIILEDTKKQLKEVGNNIKKLIEMYNMTFVKYNGGWIWVDTLTGEILPARWKSIKINGEEWFNFKYPIKAWILLEKKGYNISNYKKIENKLYILK